MRPRSDPSTHEVCVRGHQLVDGKCNKCALIYNRRRWYGIEPKEVERLAEEQNFKCAICQIPFDELVKAPCLDHDHETDVVRGILCHPCNSALGFFGDSLDRLEAAVKYLSANTN